MKNLVIIAVIAALIWYVFGRDTSIKNADKQVSVIVAFGDDLTYGEGANGAHNAYPAVLERLTGKTVINEGYLGEMAVNAAQHLPKVLAHRPQMVLIEFGANDYIQRTNQEQTVAAVGEIVDAVQNAGAIAVIVDTGGLGMGYYSKAFKKLAKKKHAVFVPAILAGVLSKREYTADMTHPNWKGYKIVADKVYDGIKPYLNGTSK